MSMLDRYKKPGGFTQLLALIETCQGSKQERLLDMIKTEDARWSEQVRAKMLNIERIYTWSDEALMEVFGTLQDLTVAIVLQSATDQLRSRLEGFISHSRMRKIEDLFKSQPPTFAEIASTNMKIVESVRKMESDGFIRFEEIDPALVVQEDIDSILARPLPGALKAEMKAAPEAPRVLHSYSHLSDHLAVAKSRLKEAHQNGGLQVAPMEPKDYFNEAPSTDAKPPVMEMKTSASEPSIAAHSLNESRLVEIQMLKKRVSEMSKENATLRHELSLVRSKLDQIKKIA